MTDRTGCVSWSRQEIPEQSIEDAPLNTENHSQTAAFIWQVADLLRGDLKQSQYGRVILPFSKRSGNCTYPADLSAYRLSS